MDEFTLKECIGNKSIREIKIANLIYAIKEIQKIISESKMNEKELIILKKKLSIANKELEILFLIGENQNSNL